MSIRLTLLAFVLASCGQLAEDDTTDRELASFTGTITNPHGIELDGELQVAVTWLSVNTDLDPDAPGLEAFRQLLAFRPQAVEVAPRFPAAFDLTFDAPPPLGSALPVQGSKGLHAFGHLVVYEDLNANGALDMVEPGEAPIDRVLGPGPSGTRPGGTVGFTVHYVRGELPASSSPQGLTLPQGYSVVALSEDSIDLVERFEVPLEANEVAQTLMCRFVVGEHEPEAIRVEAPVADLPPAAVCDLDGARLTLEGDCEVDADDPICGAMRCERQEWVLARSLEEAPDGWPCTLSRPAVDFGGGEVVTCTGEGCPAGRCPGPERPPCAELYSGPAREHFECLGQDGYCLWDTQDVAYAVNCSSGAPEVELCESCNTILNNDDPWRAFCD